MESQRKIKFSLGGSFTPVVKTIIIINVVIFVFLYFARDKNEIVYFLGLVPAAVWKERHFWQILSYMFVHVDFMHILFNMLGLWWFGCDIERSFGGKHFLRYYLFTGIGAGLVALIVGWGDAVPTIGASGAIFGVLAAYALLFPNRVIYIYFVLPVKAKWAVLGFAILELVAVFQGSLNNVSNIAHVGGIFFGLIWFGYYLKLYRMENFRRLILRMEPKSKLRIVKNTDKGNDDDDFFGDKNGTVH